MIRHLLSTVLPIRSPKAGPDEAVRQTVLAVWLVFVAVPFLYVFRFGVDCPFLDEWRFLPVVVGERSVWEWLPAADSNHYYLPQLLWCWLVRLCGYDFRAGMYFSAWALGAAAWLLIRAARAYRGRSCLSDVLIPAVLLHESQVDVLLNGYDMAFALPVLLAAAAVHVIASRPLPTAGSLFQIAGLAVLLAACGGGGAILALPLALWLAWAGWRTVGPVMATVLSAVAASVWAAVLVEHGSHHHGAPPVSAVDPWAAGRIVAECLGGAGGPLGFPLDQRGGWGLYPLSAVCVGLFVSAVFGLLAWRIVRDTDGRLRRLGLLACGAGAAGVLAALALKRSFLPAGIGFAARYCIFSSLLLALAVTVWTPKRMWQTALAVLLAVAVQLGSVRHGDFWGAHYRHHLSRCWYRTESGEPFDDIARDMTGVVCCPGDFSPNAAKLMRDGLELCHRYRIACCRWRR